jgi:hypothetical protein
MFGNSKWNDILVSRDIGRLGELIMNNTDKIQDLDENLENSAKSRKMVQDLTKQTALLKQSIFKVHGRMGRGGHGLPNVSPRPTMPYLYTPCRQATPETALRLFQGVQMACGRLLPFWTPHAVRLWKFKDCTVTTILLILGLNQIDKIYFIIIW